MRERILFKKLIVKKFSFRCHEILDLVICIKKVRATYPYVTRYIALIIPQYLQRYALKKVYL